jgi:hypothetical protein
MSSYLLLRFLHVTSAMIFIGGIFARQLIRARAKQTDDIRVFAAPTHAAGRVEDVMVIPGNLAVIVFGVLLALLSHAPARSRPHYRIRVKGHLQDDWSAWFEGLKVTNEDNGEAVLGGPLPDQAALHAVLKRLHALNVPLLSVNRVGLADETHADRD